MSKTNEKAEPQAIYDQYPLISPHKIKPQEMERLNPAFTKLEDLKSLVPGVPYLWVLDSQGNINIGIEEPWKYPQAFGFKGDEQTWQQIKKNLIPNKIGHPSLTPVFDDKGKVITSTQTKVAYIGGEINYKNNTWLVSNYSGRYGAAKGKNSLEIQQLLNNVAQKISAVIHKEVIGRIHKPKDHYIKSYYKSWDKGSDDFHKALMVLKDFAYGQSIGSLVKRFFSRDEKNLAAVRQTISDANQKKISTVDELIKNIKSLLGNHPMDTGLQRRINFIEIQVNPTQDILSIKPKSP